MKTVKRNRILVLAVSGGPDSVYLVRSSIDRFGRDHHFLLAHVNHGSRGVNSRLDEDFVEKMAVQLGLPYVVERWSAARMKRRGKRQGANPVGFEESARAMRYSFLSKTMRDYNAERILLGHHADDQVETILMRVFEGAGISGLKGIPRETDDGIVRPILDVWKEDILKYLAKHKIHFRIDESNFDTRFERNWVRHILIPLLVKRYGKGLKKRIFILGERFRELDDYLGTEARRWIRRNVKNFHFPRKGYSLLPTVLRVKILQRLCFDRPGIAPNERLLADMDKVVCAGGPSAKLKVGKGWGLVNRYDHAVFVRAGTRRKVASGEPGLTVEEKGKVTPAQARRAAATGGKEYFDAAGIHMPLSVRPLRAGDRIRPFGMDSEKKVKEILIDRKVPRDERWGRPVVCDAGGEILWIPGVVRSARAPVGPETNKTVLLKLRRK